MKSKSKKVSFITNAAILAFAGILVRFLGFLYRLPLTNMLGDEGNGIYSAGFYLYNLFLVISSAGIPAGISKILSEKIALGEYKNVSKIFKIALVMTSLVGLILSFVMFYFASWFCNIIESPKSYYSILTLSPTIFIVSVMSVFRGYFQGFGNTVPTAISQVIEQIFNCIFSIYLVYNLVGLGIEFGAAGGTAGTGIGALAGLIYILILFMFKRKNLKSLNKSDNKIYKVNSTLEILKLILKTTVPIITGTAVFSFTNLIDMQMVSSRLQHSGVFSEQQITSLYGQLTGKYVTLTTLPVSISTALATAVIPSIAGSVIKNEKNIIKSKIDTTLRLTMILSIPAAFGMGIMADEILLLLFPNYSDGGTLLKWGAFSIIFLAFCQIVTGILNGIGKMKVPAQNALIGCVFKVFINYFLIVIPSVNILGAVISTTFCYIIASVLNFRELKKSTDFVLDFKGTFLKPTVSSLVMSFACILIYRLFFVLTLSNNISLILAVFISLFVYIISMALIKGFRKEDILLMPFGQKIVRIFEKFKLLV